MPGVPVSLPSDSESGAGKGFQGFAPLFLERGFVVNEAKETGLDEEMVSRKLVCFFLSVMSSSVYRGEEVKFVFLEVQLGERLRTADVDRGEEVFW